MFRFHQPMLPIPRLPNVPTKQIKSVTIPKSVLLPQAQTLISTLTRRWQEHLIHPLHTMSMHSVALGYHKAPTHKRLLDARNDFTHYNAKAKSPMGVVRQFSYETALLPTGQLHFLNDWIKDANVIAVKVNMFGHVVLQHHLDNHPAFYQPRFFPLSPGLPITNTKTPIFDYVEASLSNKRR